MSHPHRSVLRIILPSGAVLVLGSIFYFWYQPPETQLNDNTAMQTLPAVSAGLDRYGTVAGIPLLRAPVVKEPDTPDKHPLSLRGTSPDGELVLDQTGLPKVTPSMRRLFEYFLSTMGEQTPSAIRQQLYDHIQTRYSKRTAVATIAYFDRYVEYRIQLAEQQLEMAESSGALSLTELLQYRMQLLTNARQDKLGPAMAEAFFADEQRYDQYVIEKLSIEQNTSLTPEQKDQQLALLSQAWPEFSQTNALASQQRDVSKQVNVARNNEAQESDIYEMRSTAFGYEAAERLAALDDTRDQWQTRLDEYSQQKQRLLSSGIGDQDKSLIALRDSNFSPSEARLVQTLEKLQRL